MIDPAIISELVGEAYPTIRPVSETRARRNWIVRVGVVPTGTDLTSLASRLSEGAASSIRKAYAKTTADSQVEGAIPMVAIHQLSEHHLVICIEFAVGDAAVGDSEAISQWGALQGLDGEVRIDELQGIPRAHWFPFRKLKHWTSKHCKTLDIHNKNAKHWTSIIRKNKTKNRNNSR